ncbi:MAG: molybdate ABC transporter substrate-binding protein, partial [Caulobacteraceae bacterium]|nr:molybdate ABC transporter substrate-binding protein [Caulobacteraceae bacterium]
MRLGALLVGLLALIASDAQAAEVRVAVAANFTEPAREIARLYEARSGHEVTLSFGSSGQFYAQIRQGAPFDVFLSADAE